MKFMFLFLALYCFWQGNVVGLENNVPLPFLAFMNIVAIVAILAAWKKRLINE